MTAAGPWSSLPVDAFVAATREEQRRLLRLARALTGDEALAEDLVQDALVRAWLARDRFREGARPYPWLARILRNAFLDHVRSARVRRERPTEAPPERASPEPSPLDAVESRRRAAAVRDAVSRLPPDMALVVTLVDLDGMDYAEAAEVLDIPVGTVRSRLSRARRRLRGLLRPDAG